MELYGLVVYCKQSGLFHSIALILGGIVWFPSYGLMKALYLPSHSAHRRFESRFIVAVVDLVTGRKENAESI